MKIQVLGSASGMPSACRSSSCYLIQSGEKQYILEAGDGAARQMVCYGVDPLSLEAVFISHTHPDHVSGLFMIMQYMHLSGRKNPLPVYLPEGVLPSFESVFPFFQIFRDKWPFEFSLNPISDGSAYQDGQLQWQAVRNDHLDSNREYAAGYGLSADSYSFILGDSRCRTFFYTSDILSLDCLRGKAEGSPYLLAESTHITWEQAVRFAEKEAMTRVFLTHVPEALEHMVLPETSIPVTIVKDGQWIGR